MTVDTLSERLSAAVRGLMHDHGVTQKAVADAIERSDSYVSDRLNGKHALSVDIIAGVAALLHVSDRAIVVELEERMSGTGQGRSER